MGIVERFFPAKTAITSQAIQAEIERSENEITAHRAKLGAALAGVAAMTDEQHVKAEGEIAVIERAITRLEARIAHLNVELPTVEAAEITAAQEAANTALRKRAEAAKKAVEVEATKLLRAYDEHAAAIGDIFSRLAAINAEVAAVNIALRANPVAEAVPHTDSVHRTSPDRPASEVREMHPHWIYRDAPARHDEIAASVQEDAVRATLDATGNPVRRAETRLGRFGQIISPQLENREVVIRTHYRPGRCEESLDAIHLPPGFSGGTAHWPRKS